MPHALAAFFAWLAARLAGRRWRVGLVATCVAAAVLGQLPPLRHTYRQLAYGTELEANFRVLRAQVVNPWRPYSTVSTSHPAKMVFRLALPLLARALHLSLGHLLLGQVALGIFMYWLLAAALARALADRAAAALLLLGLSGTYFGSAFSYELTGYFDAYCYALLVVAMLARPGWLVFGLVLAGSFIDERVLLAAPLLVFWYGVAAYGWRGTPAWRYLLTRRAGAVYAAGAAYLGLRLWLAARYHLPTYTGLVGLSALRDNLQHEWLGLGYFYGLKSYWLLVLATAALLLHRHAYGLLLVLGLCAVPILGGSGLVTDITRSVAYGGPLVLISASLLGRSASLAQRRGLALALAALALLAPSYQVLGKILYQPSVGYVIAKSLINSSLLPK